MNAVMVAVVEIVVAAKAATNMYNKDRSLLGGLFAYSPIEIMKQNFAKPRILIHREDVKNVRQPPAFPIAQKALTVWRVYGAIQTVILLLAGLVLAIFTKMFAWSPWLHLIWFGFPLLSAIFSVYLFPKLRWEHWRYEVREQEIEVQHGLFVVRRTLIPMVRVQHVDVAQGPILKRYDLANISISTAATVHEIPALITEDADVLRQQISLLARVAEEDV